jgi:hypothetical protein
MSSLAGGGQDLLCGEKTPLTAWCEVFLLKPVF